MRDIEAIYRRLLALSEKTPREIEVERLATKWIKIKQENPDSFFVYSWDNINVGVQGHSVHVIDIVSGKERHDPFLTVPMVNELLDGKNPRKVINKYITCHIH